MALQTFQVKFISKRQLTPDVFLFRFHYVAPNTCIFGSGQYMILLIDQPGKSYPARRLYSIASSSCEYNVLELLIKIVPNGVGSTFVMQLKENDNVTMQGPAGMFMIRNDMKDKVFLATGTGIAPMRSMIDKLLNQSAQSFAHLFLFWGLPAYKDVYFFDELKEIADKRPQFMFKICLSREKDMSTIPPEYQRYFFLGRVPDAITDMFPGQFDTKGYTPLPEALMKKDGKYEFAHKHNLKQDFDFYICGGNPVVEALKKYLYDKGVEKANVFFEKFV